MLKQNMLLQLQFICSGKALSDLESILNVGGGVMHSTASYPPGTANNSVLLSEFQLSKEQLQRERFRRKVLTVFMGSLIAIFTANVFRLYYTLSEKVIIVRKLSFSTVKSR